MHVDGDLVVISLSVLTMVGMVTIGPLGRALADRLRGRMSAGSTQEIEERLDDVAAQLHETQRQMGEIVERQDFTERLLTQARERGLLEAPK